MNSINFLFYFQRTLNFATDATIFKKDINLQSFDKLYKLIRPIRKLKVMSKQTIRISIEICSNCKQHSWCTRHNQANYLTLAQEISKSIRAQNSQAQIQVLSVGGTKMGSFEVICQGHLLFSKLALGYFPHVTAVTKRVMNFIEDYRNGGDLKKYQPGVGSPVRSNSAFNRTGSSGFQKSPVRRNLKIAYSNSNHQQSNAADKQKQSPKKQQKNDSKQAHFVLDQKKSQTEIQTNQVIVPETKKSQPKIQSQKLVQQQKEKLQSQKKLEQHKEAIPSQKKVDQKKESQNFIIDKEEEQKQQSQIKTQQKQKKSSEKSSNKINSQQFILQEKTKQQPKKEQQNAESKSTKKLQGQNHQPKQAQKKHQKSEKQLAIETVTSIFNEYDKDRSGKLQKKQVKKLLEHILESQNKKGLKISEGAVRKWISEADSDGDGVVSLQEFIDFLLEVNE